MDVHPGYNRDLIFDIGSNNGDDIPYYLFKARQVVAIEANPALCMKIKTRFGQHIRDGRLVVENVALVGTDEEEAEFFLHQRHHVLSSLVPDHTPGSADSLFKKITVRAMNVSALVAKYGVPYYAKIDVEGYDDVVLASFVTAGIKPPYLSAECHKIGVFALLSEALGYTSFKLVDGRSVGTVYKRALFRSPVLEKTVAYSFPNHSAGPFGNDIFGEWMDKATLFKCLALQGLGWRDIHASALDQPTLRY
jgi:FkbM family methyltransferase